MSMVALIFHDQERERDDDACVQFPPAFKRQIASYLFLQLMRDQLQQEEQRERQQQQNAALQYMQHRMAGPPAPTPAISTPQHYQNMQVPIEILKVSNSFAGFSKYLKNLPVTNKTSLRSAVADREKCG